MNRPPTNTSDHDEAPPLGARDWVVPGLLTLVGLALRVFMMRYETVILDDGAQYAWLGENLVRGDLEGGLSAYWPPFYPLMIGLVSLFVSDLQLAGQIVSLSAGTLLIPLAFVFSHAQADRRVALCATFLVAVNPQLIICSAGVTTGALYGLFLLLGIHFGWRAFFRQRMGSYAICGLAIGGMYLTRPEGFGFALLVIGVAVFRLLRTRAGLRRSALCLALLVGALVVSMGPYLIYVHQQTGIWTISQKFAIHFGGIRVQMLELTPDGARANADIYYGGEAPDNSPSSPVSPSTGVDPIPAAAPAPGVSASLSITRLLKNFLENLSYQHSRLLPNIFTPFILPLATLGLFAAPWTRRRAEREAYLGLFFLATFAGYALAWSLERYFYSIIPVVLLWAALGVMRLEDWVRASFARLFRSSWSQYVLHAAVVAGLLVAMVPRFTYPMRRYDRRQATELRSAGELIRQDASSPNPVVLANTPVPAFYAGGTHHYLPKVDSDELLAFIKRRGADYVVFYEQKIWRHRMRGHRVFLNGDTTFPGLELIRRDTAKAGANVTVYRVDPPLAER